MSFSRYQEYCNNRKYHFAGAGKMIVDGKGEAQSANDYLPFALPAI